MQSDTIIKNAIVSALLLITIIQDYKVFKAIKENPQDQNKSYLLWMELWMHIIVLILIWGRNTGIAIGFFLY